MSPISTTFDVIPSRTRCQAPAGRLLRTYRILANLTQDELGRRAKVDRSVISRAENGYRTLTEAQKSRVASALGFSERGLFPEDDE